MERIGSTAAWPLAAVFTCLTPQFSEPVCLVSPIVQTPPRRLSVHLRLCGGLILCFGAACSASDAVAELLCCGTGAFRFGVANIASNRPFWPPARPALLLAVWAIAN